jgi:hypothetical protein
MLFFDIFFYFQGVVLTLKKQIANKLVHFSSDCYPSSLAFPHSSRSWLLAIHLSILLYRYISYIDEKL